jgi:hypothetical protein
MWSRDLDGMESTTRKPNKAIGDRVDKEVRAAERLGKK